MKDKIYFSKLKEGAKIPSKREEDGCYDIYACFDEDYIVIDPCQIKLIPTGIASCFNKKYRIELRERGSSGIKGLARRAGQIDSGYRNEWFVPINNTTNKTIYIAKNVEELKEEIDEDLLPYCVFYPYDKAICQAALEFVPDVDVEEIPYDELIKFASERGMGALGSSGK
jgi:dUTP pyrophosphatase